MKALTMISTVPSGLLALGLLGGAAALWLGYHYFNPHARERRRRERSHGRVVSKSKRIMIKLAAKAPKSRGNGKG
jgi:hypothetical protein